jgi:hypothetical protein
MRPLEVEVPATEKSVPGVTVPTPKKPVTLLWVNTLSVVDPRVKTLPYSGVEEPILNTPAIVEVASVEVAVNAVKEGVDDPETWKKWFDPDDTMSTDTYPSPPVEKVCTPVVRLFNE